MDELVTRNERLALKMQAHGYRHAYAEEHTRQFLAHQMRKFRGNVTQEEFATKLGCGRSNVGHYENPKFIRWSLQSLFELARKLDVAVFVRFVDFRTFIQLTDDQSDTALRPSSYESMEDGLLGKLKQNFQVDQRVTINRTTDPELDGHRGTILGMASTYAEVDFYIVLLDTPHTKTGYKAIQMIESCLDPLSNGAPE